MDELFVNNKDECKLISASAKQIIKIKETSKHSDFVRSQKCVQCQHCLGHMSTTHVYCECGRALTRAFNTPEIRSQVARFTKMNNELLTGSLFSRSESGSQRSHLLGQSGEKEFGRYGSGHSVLKEIA